MDYETLTDEEIQAKLDEAILTSDPEKLTDEELNRRLYLAENRHQSPDFSELPLKAAQTAAKIVDYPMVVVRSGVDAVSDIFSGKSISESAGKIGDALMGNAVTSQKLAEKAGIPDSTIPGTDIPQSAAAGLALDMTIGVPTAKAIGEGAKLAGKGVRKVLNADELALKATGTRSKDVQSMIHGSPVEDPMKQSRKYADYATENFIRPLNSTEKLLKKVGMRWKKAGETIGELRERNAINVSRWLESNPNSPDVKEYLDNSFNPKNSIHRIYAEIDQEIPSARAAEQIKDLVGKELEALHLKYQGQEIPMKDLSDLKAYWQNEINFGKESADYSIREAANNFLQKEANLAIDNEFKFADKWMNGSDKAKHSKLKEEYGMLSRMYSNIAAKAAREGSERSNILTTINPLNQTRLQTTISSIPNPPASVVPGKKSIGVGIGAGASQTFNMMPGGSKEPTIGGFSVFQTKEVSPQEGQLMEMEIQQSEISNTEKARRLNLLRKHGRVYLGQ